MSKKSTSFLDRDIEKLIKTSIDTITKVSLLKHFFDHRHETLSVSRIIELLGREETILREVEELVRCNLLEKVIGEEGLVEYRLTSDRSLLIRIESFLGSFKDPQARLRVIALILETQTFSE